jgi:TfoX/Sxy family transcriptional regulator of competence genes
MPTDASFANYVLEQIALPGRVALKKMFGEYALYVDGRVVALLCDDQLFVKPLEPLRARLAHVDEAAPYPGAKPHFRIADELERPADLTALLLEAARLLPLPKARAAKKKGASGARAGKGTATTGKKRRT